MKVNLLLFASLMMHLGVAIGQDQKQVFSRSLVWEKPANKTGDDGNAIPVMVCSECQNLFQGNRIPYLSRIEKGMKVKNIRLIKADWKPIPFWEMNAIDTLAYFNSQEFILESTESQRVPSTRVGIRTIRKQDGTWERLQKATIEYVFSPLPQNHSVPARVASAENSILATGQWLKVGVTQSGVFAMSGTQLASAGLPVVGKNPNHIRMYGTGGKMLSEANRDFKFDDIPEIAIQVLDGGDGVFDASDRILFYGQDPNGWLYNSSVKAYQYQKNIYSDTSYYFVGLVSSGTPLRIQPQFSLLNQDVIVNYYTERYIYSPDKINVISAGREWYGDALDFVTTKDISFPVSQLLCDSLVRIRTEIMARSSVPTTMSIKLNNILLSGPITLPSTSSQYQYGFGNTFSTFTTIPCNSNSININYSYSKQGNPASIGYINYLEINAKRSISWNGSNFGFRCDAFPGKKVGLDLRNFAPTTRVWNVTYPAMATDLVSPNAIFTVSQDTLMEFFAFRDENLPGPAIIKQVMNQNIRGMAVPDMIIVTHPNFLAEANRLAEFRREHDSLSVEVVDIEKVYNEFSSGSQDITAIRNMAMLHYYKDANKSLKYLLLFGDCSFDYKNRVANNTNFVPIYESPTSLNIISSYASDDYFGILNRTKGNWDTNDLMDIGVGRLPAKSPSEARILVDKLINYHSATETLGPWRLQFTFVADDGDGCTHSDQSNDLAEFILANYPNAITKKLFVGAYPQVSNAGGFTSPACSNDIINNIESGTLFVNYTGHGGETVWADEYLFTNEIIGRLKNKNKLPIFVTATCDFGRHDLPAQVSGAENLMINGNGGAIAVVTTGRPVNAFSNLLINQALYKSMFTAGQGFSGRMGDIMRTCKNLNSDKINNRGFCLLGDPSFKVALPEKEIVVTEMNTDSIRGLDLVEFSGEIRKQNVIDENFNGKIFATVFDRPSILLINDNESVWSCFNKTYPYLKNKLFDGSEKVTNGKFRFRFIASKDLSYQIGLGKINMYAHDVNRFTDATGFRKDIKVGGLNPTPWPDTEGPKVKGFMNDTTFINYGLVGTNANLLVFLEASSGINVSGLGMGHDLTATLDGSLVYILNSYYQSAEGNYQKGSLIFPFRGLSNGLHNIVIKAWDNNNQSATYTVWFTVSGCQDLEKISNNLKVFPNPFIDQVHVTLENSFAGNPVSIDMRIFDILGRPVVEKSWTFENSFARLGAFNELAWNGLHEDGSRFPAATYICQIRLKSDTEGCEYKINQKIVLLR